MPSGTPSQTTQYVYGVTTAGGSGINSNDLLAKVEYPDPTTGSPSTVASNQESYTYNRLGDITTFTDPNGTTHTYSYDVLGRQTSDAVTTLGANVDGSVLRRTTAYNALGLPYLYTSYNAASGGSIVNQVQDVYNGLGQLTGEYQEQGGAVNASISPEVRYVYTEMSGGQNNSRLTQMIYPDGRKIDYVYNAGLDSSISRLSAIADDNGGTPGTVLEGYTYLGLDTIVQYAHPQDGINLTYIQPGTTGAAGDQYVGLDRFGRVIDQNWVKTSTGVSTDRFQYAYDRTGNVLYSNNLVNPAQSELYQASGVASNSAYDPLGRQVAFARGTLSSSSGTGGPLNTVSTASRSQSWSLDSLGNWSSVTSNGSTTTRGFNAQNQTASVSGGTAPTYDHNGNTIGDAGITYVYNAWNQLVAARNGSTTVASYGYDALGRRITETYGGTVNHLYYSPQWQVIEERQNGTAASNVTYQYVWGAGYVDEMVLRDTYSGGTIVPADRLYAQWNADGSVTALVNTSGTVVERYLYDPYGAATITDASWTPRPGNTSSYGWRYLFQGGRLDTQGGALTTATGWYDFRNRDLIASQGTWAERDPLGFGGGQMNLYQFVGSSPADGTDPYGLWGFYRWLYTGDGNASDQIYAAAMEGAGQSTLDGSKRIEGMANAAKAFDPTMTSAGIEATMQGIQARDGDAANTLKQAAVDQAIGFGIGKGIQVAGKAAKGLRGAAKSAAGKLDDAGKATCPMQRNPGCFAAGTPVLTPDGSVAIERLRPGDLILAVPEDDPDAEPVPRAIEDTIQNYLPTLDLKVSGWAIRTTAEHPFWVVGRGWVAAQQLRPGDRLRAHDGRALEVEAVDGSGEAAAVYNMSVADYHTYFVGSPLWGFSVWTHNSDVCPGLAGGAPNGGLGSLVKVNKADPAADALAKKLGGESRVKFANGPDNEFDAVSDLYIAQTKPANFKLGSRFRDQAKTTFETAQATGRTPYFHFDGPPEAAVLNQLQKYAQRYGIQPVIDISPL